MIPEILKICCAVFTTFFFISGCEQAVTDKTQQTASQKSDPFDITAHNLNLDPIKPGLWIARTEPRDPKKELPFPIEIITDPLIADRIKNGQRPDGKKMYSIPSGLPEFIPEKYKKHALDIYPMKISEQEGIKSGNINIYGHFIDPPYKFQIVVVDNDARVLLNGIDTKIFNLIKKAEKTTNQKKKSSQANESNQGNESNIRRLGMPLGFVKLAEKHVKKARRYVDTCSCKHGDDVCMKNLMTYLEKDQRVANIAVRNKYVTYEFTSSDIKFENLKKRNGIIVGSPRCPPPDSYEWVEENDSIEIKLKMKIYEVNSRNRKVLNRLCFFLAGTSKLKFPTTFFSKLV